MTDRPEIDPKRTLSGPFGPNGPRKIQYRHAKRLSRYFGLEDAAPLHQALQDWSDIYFSNNAVRLRTHKERADELDRVYGAISKFIAYTKNDDRSAAAFRQQLDNEIEAFEFRIRREFPDMDVTPAMHSAQILQLIENAAAKFLQTSEGALDESRRARKHSPELRRQEKNPGLTLLVQNMKTFWDAGLLDHGTFKVNNRLPDPADKPAVKFAILVARLIDPSLQRKTIISHMQTKQRSKPRK